MSNAALAVQKAFFQALSSHAPLMAEVTAIIDGPAADQPLPFVQLGDMIETDWSTKTFAGREHRVSVHVWSSAAASVPARQLLALVDDALSAGLPALTGHHLASFRFLQTRVLPADDGRTRHGIAEFRLRTQPLG